MSASFRCFTVSCVTLFSFLATAAADDAYYRVKLADLKIEGQRPERTQPDWRFRERTWAMCPYVVLDGKGEVYLGDSNVPADVPWGTPQFDGLNETINIRRPNAGEITGLLYWPKPDWSGMTAFKFTISNPKTSDEARKEFQQAKARHYCMLRDRNIPGGAWFRHEMQKALTDENNKLPEQNPAWARWNRFNAGDGMTRTYELFSGGRAISENLQLDRPLQTRGEKQEATVDLKTIEGITVKEIDWTPLIKDLKPTLDPLAAYVPADQHVIFFQSFATAVETADQAELQGTPVLHLAEPRSEDAMTAKRYQRQLGLSLSGLGRLLGPSVVRSVALTGSDLSFRTGTDVAVLFETHNPSVLEGMLLAQVKMSSSKTPDVKDETGEMNGLKYHGFRSPDRAVSSYVARIDNAVVVTNSLEQLKRLADAAQKKTPAIASLPEYVFFRNRYKLGDAEETGFVFLSDATIRRWCGPRWRIATSRQSRDLAVLTELQAANLDALVKKTVEPGTIYTNFATADIGKLSLDAAGVHSSVQGSLDFMTPIVEIPLDKVTQAEAAAYKQWRDGYQRNWSWAFDPIGIRLTLQPKKLAADVTVMPLILASQYNTGFWAATKDGKIAPNAGDPHDALLQIILAIDVKSPQFRQAENFISTMSNGITFGWIGRYVTTYFDDDPIWAELAKKAAEKGKNFDHTLWENFHRLPFAVQIDVSNGFKLTAFLAAARTWVEQSSPGMTTWETLKYKDQPYVKVTPTDRARGDRKEMENLAIYYLASGDAFLITPHEGLLKRAIDRQLVRQAAKSDKKSADAAPAGNAKAAAKTWLGENVAVQADRKALELGLGLFDTMNRDQRQSAMQVRSWSNLPILNEWKRLYPDLDPVEVHERIWKIRLICPGGGKYVWSEKYRTMESTAYGHPADPKVGPVVVPVLSDFSTTSCGLTFEQDGLRARVSLERSATKKP